MIQSKYRVILTIISILVLVSCEIEKTEYQSALDPVSFGGFRLGYFILHSQSISYYSSEVNKVYPDIYAHQNGKPLGNGIHSFYIQHDGLITFQKDNKIEFIDEVNIISEGFQEIEKPRDIYGSPGGYLLISFGDTGNEGIAMVDMVEKKIVKTQYIGIRAGRIYQKDNYIYVLSDGTIMNDSIIEKYYYQENSDTFLLKIESFEIGIRPVDFVTIPIHYEDYTHTGMAILCKGNATIPASIVLFDLITEKVIKTYSFESPDIIPENLFWFPDYWNWYHGDQSKERIMVSHINDKLYTLTLNDPVQISVLINRNIDFLISTDDYCLAVSRDTVGTESYLYRFDITTLELVDSLSIPPKALRLVH